jgi:radical SAM superfamily enzyme YgiQ (UPF0313 family)
MSCKASNPGDFIQTPGPNVSSKTIKRVALIQSLKLAEAVGHSLPVGLLSLASSIKEHGYDPVVLDLYLQNVRQNHPPDYFKKIAERILGNGCDVLGFNVMCSNLPVVLLTAEECKKLAPQLPIIFGGPEVSFEEVELMNTFEQVDIIVRGEGEITLVEVLEALENKRNLSEVEGITFRENDQIIKNPDRPLIKDLDQLPFLDYSLIPKLNVYQGRIEGGRGCPFSCTFCSTCLMWKRKVRMRSPQRVAQELRDACRLFKNTYIEISHDHLLVSRKFAEEFLSLIADEDLSWACFARLDSLDESLIKKLKRAGCWKVLLGIETGSTETQKKIKKNLSLSRLPQALEWFSQNEVGVVIYLIIGFPGETESQINETLLLALNSKSLYPSISINIPLLTFFKGTELYTEAKEKNIQYKYQENIGSPLTTGHPAELSLIKKYPRIFPSFYYFGDGGISPEILRKISFLFYFLLRSYAHLVLSLLEHLSLTPFQLGQELIAYFDAEGVDWHTTHGCYFPQYVAPFKKFIRENASPLCKEFFWWEESFKQWEEKSNKVNPPP